MTDTGEYQASDSLLPGQGYTPDYGINQSVSPSNSSEAAEIMPRPSSINSVMRSAGNSERVRVRVRVWREAMCSLIACLASLVNGMMLGFSSPALTQLQFSIPVEDRIDPSNIKYSLFGALGPIGAMFGSLVACPISNRVGRKRALILSGVPALIGWLMIALAHLASSHEHAFYGILLTGRMLTGFSSGWSISCVSVYISEIASAEWKSSFGNCNQLFITIGILLPYIFGIEYKIGVSVQYWVIALIAAGFVVIFELLMLFTSETPRWLLSKGMDENAIRVLKVLRGPNFTEELEKIKESVRVQPTYSVIEQLMEFRHRSIITPFLLVIMLMFFQQFSGINVAIFYASHIFLEAGLSQHQVNLIVAIAIGVVQVIATLVPVILVKCFGQKDLLTMSSIGMFLSSLVLGIYFYVYNSICESCLVGDPACNLTIVHDSVHKHFPCNTTKFGYLAIVCIVIFIISYSLGWGPIPWTSMSELMPNRVRTLGGSIATFTNWSFVTIITLCFKYYSRPPINNDGAWWTFSFIMFVAIFMVVLFLPKIKGLSLEEIQKYFEQGHIFAVSCFRQRPVTPPPQPQI